ncbi:MAG: C_GCAxxG_C_C family protein [Firmicutes bacterium]|nr:C_GCAxxG_C_C family protein [Bacillota bacterium]
MTEKGKPSIEATIDSAEKLFNSGFNCAESVLLSIAKHYGIEDPPVPRIATAFGGGMSRRQMTCGALSGGLMSIGLIKGRDSGKEKSDPAYSLGGELIDYFASKNRSTNCREIVGLDFNNHAEHEQFRANERNTICVPMVRDVCGWLLQRLS